MHELLPKSELELCVTSMVMMDGTLEVSNPAKNKGLGYCGGGDARHWDGLWPASETIHTCEQTSEPSEWGKWSDVVDVDIPEPGIRRVKKAIESSGVLV